MTWNRHRLYTVNQLIFATIYFHVLAFIEIFVAIFLFADCQTGLCKNNVYMVIFAVINFRKFLFFVKINWLTVYLKFRNSAEFHEDLFNTFVNNKLYPTSSHIICYIYWV